MKTAFVKEPSIVSIKETETPSIESGGILVEMHACGICGSDLEKVFGQYGQPSMRLGHEPAGVIVDVGSDVKEFKIGDRVFTHHHVPCYECHMCDHGCETMCSKYYETNLVPCGLSDVYVVPAWNVSHGGVLKIPDSLSFEEAAMIEPLACCIRAWSKLNYKRGDSIAIFGMGATGMLHAMLARINNFDKIFGLDVNEFRLKFSARFGIDTISATDESRHTKIQTKVDDGVDIALVSTSNMNALYDALKVVRSGGTVMMFGVPSKGSILKTEMDEIYSREITLMTSYAASDSDTRKALDLLHTGQLDVKQLITHKYHLDDSMNAFDHARDGSDAIKIIILGKT